MHAKACLLLVACLTACTSNAPELQPGSPPSPQASASTPMPDTTPEAEKSKLDKIVRKGMGYADFRKQALALGWSPVVDPECKSNVVGANFEQVCAADAKLCKVCDEMSELSAYSGDAHSLSVFQNTTSHLRMEVSALGELEYWNVTGDDPGLKVTGWEISPATAKR